MRKRIPVVTFIILGLNVLGLIYEYKAGENYACYQYGMYQGALEGGEYLRLIVSAFLHLGIYHFACNMICLVAYGFDLENKIGPFKYALVYAAGILRHVSAVDVWRGGSADRRPIRSAA